MTSVALSLSLFVKLNIIINLHLANAETILILLNVLGGLDFSLNQIGISLSVVGAILLPFSLFLFPLVS